MPGVVFRRSGTRAGEASDRADFVEPSLNLLAHAQVLEIDIGSRCGGHGVCGGDRVRPRASVPFSPVTDAEREHLSPAEIDAGWRLACQCFPNDATADVEVELPGKGLGIPL